MLKLYRKLAVIFGMTMAFQQLAIAKPIFDRYIGRLDLEKRGLSQLAKLDFISHRNAENDLKIMAVLSLYFGGFDSSEYVSYHFDDVEYNLIRGTLTFSQNDQDLTIKTETFEGAFILASVRSSTGRNVGKLTLQKTEIRELQEQKYITELSGEYRAYCKERSNYLKIQTYRSTSDTVRIGNPFGAYKIKGQFAASIPRLCRTSSPCVTNQVVDGSYNFFNGRLTLYGENSTEQCQINTNGDIQCGECTYSKDKKPLDTSVWKSTDPFPKINSGPSSISFLRPGEYQGYMYHDRRKTYQRMSLSIVGYQKDEENNYLLSSVANLYFGDFNSNEVLTYRYEDQIVNVLNNSFVLERTSGDVDSILKISEIGNGYLKGTWYSILFGRVGTFYISKDGPPPLPKEAPIMASLTDEFESSKHFLDLEVYLGQTPVNTENPFFPLQFAGYFSYRSGIASRIMVTGGSYDFYTGKIGLELDEGKRYSTGVVSKDSRLMSLRWSSKGFATVMQDYGLQQFKRTGE